MADLSNETSFLAALTPSLTDKVAQLFGIRTAWLEGHDDKIYDYLWTRKDPKVLWDYVRKIATLEGETHDFPLRIFVADKHLDRNSYSGQYIVPVVYEPLFELGDDTICRYHIFRDGYSWDHAPSRIDLKVVARLTYKRLRFPVPICQITSAEIDALLGGFAVPGNLWTGALLTNPSLEDYALSREESGIAKEVDELPLVLEYITQNGLDQISHQPESISSQKDKVPVAEPAAKLTDWKDIARSIADELDAKDAACEARDSLRNLADRIAVEMRKRSINGPRGPVSGATVLREALQGRRWSPKRSR